MACQVIQKISKLFVTFLLLSSVFCLISCMDLASNERSKKAAVRKVTYKPGQVYTMRGLGGVFSRGMNHLEDSLEDNYSVRTSSTIWYQANKLSNYIIKHHNDKTLQGPIILVGHSLGANEQIKVAQNLARANIPVELLLTVDAVAPVIVPGNVKHVFNIYKPGIVPMISGRTLKALDPLHTEIDNFNVNSRLKNVYMNHITIDKNSTVQKIMLEKVLASIQEANKNSGKRVL